MKTDTMSVPVAESQPTPTPKVAEIANTADVAPTVVGQRALTNHDVRRLQKGLREIGFDPGPVDGIAGARTKAAYVRLQSGCSKLAPRLEELLNTAEGLSAGAAAGDKLPNGHETQEIQRRLRESGFDPGPVDGIFGSRTQLALRKFKGGCLIAEEFKGVLNESLRVIAPETGGNQPAKLSISSKAERVAVRRGAEDRQPPVVQHAREDVRILQLRLRDAGFDPGPFDGVMGPKTKSALAQYEASRGGEKTKASLKNPSDREDY